MVSSRNQLAHGPRPLSFADRGCVVPFESPSLFAARVRADERSGLVILLRNFAASGAVYVLPWRELPGVLPVTPFDRALHAAIADTGARTPFAVAAVAGAVSASTGAAGRTESAAPALATLHAALLARALPELAGDSTALGAPTVDRIAGLVRQAAEQAAMPASELFGWLEGVAKALLPIGLETCPGPLRRLHAELTAFARHLRRRADTAPTEAHFYQEKVTRAAAETVGCSDSCIALVDRALPLLLDTRSGAPVQRSRLGECVERLAWLQDGWEQVLDRYAQCFARRNGGASESELATIAALAPLVPEDALLSA